MTRARVLAAAAAAAVLALAGAGCDRRPTLVPASADSTAVAVDSLSVYARRAADRWDAGADDEAAALSARVVLEALRLRPTAPWPERAAGVLDSLGIAAETAGDERLLVLNLFSRARAGDASYAYLYWREDGPRVQPLESADLHLTAATGRGFDEQSRALDSSQVAVLWGRRAGSGLQPMLMVWSRAEGGRWDLVQSLGVDSLGGTGTGEFVGSDTSLALTTRTYRPTPWFDECATCPHVFHERRFAWRPEGFVRTDDQVVPSPYSSFTAFIDALMDGDRERASRYAVDPSLVEFAKRLEWHVPGRGRWRLAPVSDEGMTSMVFLRGAKDAFRVTFEPRDGDWVVAGFEPAERPVD